MLYYVDGYNLLFRLSYHYSSLQEEREHIIHKLAILVETLKLQLILVFDAGHAVREMVRSHVGALDIVYTNAGETADEWIVSALYRNKQPSTLVTSDKQLIRLARAAGAASLSPEEFLHLLETKLKKRKRRPSPSVARKAPPLTPPLPSVVTPGSPEYYLQAFESALPPPTKKPKPPVEYISETERWLRLFIPK